MIVDRLNSEHYTWGNNCDSWILCNEKNLNVKFESMPPNTNEQKHIHKIVQQFFFILNGTATFNINGEDITVKPQQGITIKPNTIHCISNNSTEHLEFLVISQPEVGQDRINKET